jgi:predicted Zn-dependent protease
VSDAFSRAPRLLALPTGVTLEVLDADGSFGDALHRAGVSVPLPVRLQRRWYAVLMIVAALVGLLAAGYFKGLPAAARWLAFALSPRLENRMGEQLLMVLDRHYLKASRLDPTRRARINERFSRAAAAIAPGVPCRLEFRAAGKEVNALALPGGIVVLLDGLVTFAEDDNAVLGVLGHELGHVVHKHSTRQIVQSIGVGSLAGLLWGDFSGVAASVPIALGVLRYSREFEVEADDFGVALLHAQGLSTRPLYEFFVRLHARETERGRADIPIFLSTHPSIDERIERLRQESR